jgi:lipid II:glycine glycyltransferase (peptidoglycan interpeptide bridge formation enzyme)
MKIVNITSQVQWDKWLQSHSQNNSFTQSWAWGDVLLSEGKQVERLAIVEGEEVSAQAQIVYSKLPFGWQYAFCPGGPVTGEEKIYETTLDYLKKNNSVFFRVEPENKFKILNFKIQKTIDINPPATLVLDLKKTEEELLAGMHQKTRYNIHLAEKKGLQVNNEKNLEVFWALMNKTGSRDKFSLHQKSHYEKVLESPITHQLTAYFNGKPVAVAVFVGFGNTFTYLYGASDYENRDLMAPYLLQWQGIKMGKVGGYQKYDFFGVAPVKDGNYDTKHQYAGVTRFKLGFGGAPCQAPGTLDLIIKSQKYFIYKFFRLLRRLF